MADYADHFSLTYPVAASLVSLNLSMILLIFFTFLIFYNFYSFLNFFSPSTSPSAIAFSISSLL